jgi:hypothetical protein
VIVLLMKCPSCKHDVRRDHNGNGCKRLDECSCRSTQNELLLMGSAKMPKAHRDRDLIIRVGIGIAGGIIVVIVGLHFLEQVKGNAQAQAGVLAGIITFLGGVFAAAYKEISSYYQEKSINLQKRWDNIFPYIEKYYNPWINSARILKEGIVLLLDDKKKVEIDRLLYNLLLFYGYRLRLVINAGAIILLPSVEDERMVLLKYLNVMNH